MICARLNKKDAILAAFPVRLRNDEVQERDTALGEIYKIARLRLEDLIRMNASLRSGLRSGRSSPTGRDGSPSRPKNWLVRAKSTLDLANTRTSTDGSESRPYPSVWNTADAADIVMGKLSTHVLDLLHGRPAAGMKIELHSTDTHALLKTVCHQHRWPYGRAVADRRRVDDRRIRTHLPRRRLLRRKSVSRPRAGALPHRRCDPPITTFRCSALHGPTAPIAAVDAPLRRTRPHQR